MRYLLQLSLSRMAVNRPPTCPYANRWFADSYNLVLKARSRKAALAAGLKVLKADSRYADYAEARDWRVDGAVRILTEDYTS